MLPKDYKQGTVYVNQNGKQIPIGIHNELQLDKAIDQSIEKGPLEIYNGKASITLRFKPVGKYLNLKLITCWSNNTCRLFYKAKQAKRWKTEKKLLKKFQKSAIKDMKDIGVYYEKDRIVGSYQGIKTALRGERMQHMLHKKRM